MPPWARGAMGRGVDGWLEGCGFESRLCGEIFCYNFLKLFRIIPLIQYTFAQC